VLDTVTEEVVVRDVPALMSGRRMADYFAALSGSVLGITGSDREPR
jgi:hypothetical protein